MQNPAKAAMADTVTPAQSASSSYEARLAVLRAEECQQQRRHMQLSYLRLAFAIAVVVLLLPPRLWALLPVLAFALAARAHDRVLRQLAQTRRLLAFYEHALARTQDRWTGLRPRSTRLPLTQNLFADDLDLFGPGSLFELLCEARTTLGEDRLASWLLTPAAAEDLMARHAAIRDLQGRQTLREATARAPGPELAHVPLDTLRSWGEDDHQRLPRALQIAVPALVLLFIAAVWLSVKLHTLYPLLILALLNSGLLYALQRLFQGVFAHLGNVSRSLRTVGALMRASEAEIFHTSRLQQLQAKLHGSKQGASATIAQLARLATWAEARSNYLVRILDLLLPYSLQLALLTGRWRSTYGPQLASWLDTVAEMEALSSLAAYSFEHPEDPFPQFAAEAPWFHATGLAHPLLSHAAAVRNDLSLGGEGVARLLLISGSNMSGKSTLLRSVGINAVLAFAGAPVRAHSLRLSPLTLAASIQVNDSLQGGRSRFYAEILRLRAITEAARTRPPVLFLVDELLSGTNSSDRLRGAQGLVEELLHLGAIGLLSTHDLALTAIATKQTAVRNAHFQDQVTEDRLLFDYKLRDGVLLHSNGLALMRLVGLHV